MPKAKVTGKDPVKKDKTAIKVVPIITEKDLLSTVDVTGANLDKAIATAVKNAVTLQKQFQIIAVSVMQHLATHKDIRIVRDLFTKMPDSLNTNSMKAFFDKYATVKFDDEGQVFYNKARTLKLADALENAWWKAKAQSPYVPFNFETELSKLIDRASAKLAKPKAGDKVTAAQINALRAIAKPVTETPVTEVQAA